MSASALRVDVNGAPRVLAAPALAGLLAEMGLSDRRGVAVAVNGVVVPRAEWGSRLLAAGDAIEVVAAVQGG